MNLNNQNLLILFKTGRLDEKAIACEIESLHEILLSIETPEQFCIAHELVNRNKITSNPKKILSEAKHFRLRTFRFLINKN